jgi:glycolate oxidase FAD binding subunit
VATHAASTPEEVSSLLADASAARRPIVVRGGGTKASWSHAGTDGREELSTRGLNRLLAHRHGDLTATVEAGAVLGDVNGELARHGQWIPLDPNWPDRATIGGIVSANDSGPRRHRFGGPRDLIIGIEIARADGVRAKAGGIVVKNVAGYDLARLMTGSFGCLAVVLNATFKLYPLAPASRTLVIDVPDAAAVRAIVKALDARHLTPTAVEIQSPPTRLLVRFESIPASVNAQTDQTAKIAADSGGRAVPVDGKEEEQQWAAHRDRSWSCAAVLKVTLLPNDLPNIVDLIARTTGADFVITGRAGLGVLTVGLNGTPASQVAVIEALRKRPARTGSTTLLHAPDELRAAVGTWDPPGDSFKIMQGLKRAFDPNGILNPGGGPLGI